MNRGLVHYNWFWIEAHVGLVDYSWKTKLLKFLVFFSIVVEFYVDLQSSVFRFSWVTNFSSSFLNKSEKNRASYERFAGMLWEEICNHLQNDTNPNFTLSFFFILVCQNDPNDPVYCRFILKIVIGPTTGDAGVLINFYYFSTFPGSCVLKVSVVTFPLRQYSSYLFCSQLRYS